MGRTVLVRGPPSRWQSRTTCYPSAVPTQLEALHETYYPAVHAIQPPQSWNAMQVLYQQRQQHCARSEIVPAEVTHV
jgi:hypothetical protein